jgi:hypothetical protein
MGLFILIESSITGKVVVGNFKTELAAQNKAFQLWNDYCDYEIYKLV